MNDELRCKGKKKVRKKDVKRARNPKIRIKFATE
jgi:hypothetical protein